MQTFTANQAKTHWGEFLDLNHLGSLQSRVAGCTQGRAVGGDSTGADPTTLEPAIWMTTGSSAQPSSLKRLGSYWAMKICSPCQPLKGCAS